MKFEIVNVVATAVLDQQLNLEELRKFDDIFHDSDVCARVIYIFSVLQKNLILLMVIENQKTYRLGSIVKGDFNILLTILW